MALASDRYQSVGNEPRRSSPDEADFAWRQYVVGVSDFLPNDREFLAERARRRSLCGSSVARGIGCLDRRTKRRPQHLLWVACSLGLFRIYPPALTQTISNDDGFLHSQSDGKADAGNFPVPPFVAGCLAAWQIPRSDVGG